MENERGRLAVTKAAWISTALALLAAAAGGSIPALAQDGGQDLTIYAAICPVDYAGESFFEDCFDTAGAGFRFDPRVDMETIGSPTATDGTGFVSFDITGWTPGSIAVPAYGREDARDPDTNERLIDDVGAVACVAGGEQLEIGRVAVDSAFPVIAIDVPTSEDVRCDCYFVPRTVGSLSEDVGTSTVQPSAGVEVSALPNTGAGGARSGQDVDAVRSAAVAALLVGALWFGRRRRTAA